MREFIIGLDIGGTKLAAVVSDHSGNILKKVRRPTESHLGYEAARDKLFDMVYEVVSEAGITISEAIGIGVSCGGPLDTKTGVVYSPPNLPGWDAVPLKAEIEKEFKIPTVIENDANASALAEWMFGAAKGYKYVFYMTMGTGIGGGIVIDGQIYHGANDSAGEVGHQIILLNGPLCGCGQRGCLEALCSGPAIARRTKEALLTNPDSLILQLAGGKIEDVKGEHLTQAARQGDDLAKKLLDETAMYMGWGIANLVNILNPEVVIIGTIATAEKDLILDPIRNYVSKFAMRRPAEAVKILPAQLGESVGDLAAVALIMQPLTPNP
jgi:glucokinase